MTETERIVKKILGERELDFARWKILMGKIDDLDEKRRDLQSELHRITKQSDALYIEMRKLWDFVKIDSKGESK